MLEIKLYGLQCKNCVEIVALLDEVLPTIGIPYAVEKHYDFLEVMKMGFITIPVLMINGETVAVGQVPTEDELRTKIYSIIKG